MERLEGKTALVTGSGRNIGRAIALKLAGEGANVVVNARSNWEEAESVADEVRALGVDALPVLADVADRAQVEAMFAAAAERFGKVDVLVSNAAIRPHKPFTELSLDDWERVRGVVLDGAFYCARNAIPAMQANGFGRIVFLTGDGAWNGSAERSHVWRPRWASSVWRGGWPPSSRPATSGSTSSRRAASTPAATWPGIPDRTWPTRRRYRWAAWGTSTTSQPPWCSWPPTTAASSPARPSTSTAARRISSRTIYLEYCESDLPTFINRRAPTRDAPTLRLGIGRGNPCGCPVYPSIQW